MALQTTTNGLGSLRELDAHPIRNLVKQMEAERAQFRALLTDLVQALSALRIEPTIELQAPEHESGDRESERKRLTVHRDRSGLITHIDIEEI